MNEALNHALWLAGGVAAGLLFFRAAVAFGPRAERALLAGALLVVASVYPLLAASAGSGQWLLPEIVAGAVFAALAVLGWVRSPLWWSVGWVLHAAWDSPVHLVSSASAFVPAAYVLLCVGFDLVMALAVYLRFRKHARTGSGTAAHP